VRTNNRPPRSNTGGRYNENSRPQGRQWNNNGNGNRENDGASRNNRPARTGCHVCGTIGCHTWFHQNQRGRLPAETTPRDNVRRGIELRDVPPPDANPSVDRRCPICFNFYCVDPNQCVKVIRSRGPARSCSLCYELKCPGPRNCEGRIDSRNTFDTIRRTTMEPQVPEQLNCPRVPHEGYGSSGMDSRPQLR